MAPQRVGRDASGRRTSDVCQAGRPRADQTVSREEPEGWEANVKPAPPNRRDAPDASAPQPGDAGLLVVLGLDNLAAPIKAVRAHMDLAGRRLGGQRRSGEKIVRAVLAASRSRFLILLDSHRNTRDKVKRAILQRFGPF
jgi:hypothetical protein